MSRPGFELRHLRTFVAVAERRSFTQAADALHIAQQAVSQQIKALEQALGVTLLTRTPRQVQLTPAGVVFLADCRRVLAAADRAAGRAQAAARGEVGTVRLAYTLTTAWDTIPRLLARISEVHRQLKVEAREVFGGDIPSLLLAERYDMALAPATRYPSGFRSRTIRREPMRIVLSDRDPLALRDRLPLEAVADRSFEIWPHEMAPGFYEAVTGTCRAAGFEPALDEHATGNTVWGNIARGRGVGLINASLAEQLPRGVALVDLANSSPTLNYDMVWLHAGLQVIARVLDVADRLAQEQGWV
jgi:DNA-binding transcriptional LysR family regulator